MIDMASIMNKSTSISSTRDGQYNKCDSDLIPSYTRPRITDIVIKLSKEANVL